MRLLSFFLLCLATSLSAQDLLVSSRNTDQVLRFDSAGSFLGVFASGGGLDNPVGLTFGPGGDLFVASANTDQVLRFRGSDGSFLGVFASDPSVVGLRQLNFGPDGDLYVSAGTSDGVYRFDGSTGAFRGVVAIGNGLDGPTSFTFGPDGLLYVGSVNTNEVQRYDPRTGAFLGVFASQFLRGPHDLAFGPDGSLIVSNAFGMNKVVRFDGQTGAFLGVLIADSALRNPLGITIGHDGALYLANQTPNEIRRYDVSTGALIDVFVAAGAGGLDGPLFQTFTPATVPFQIARLTPGTAGLANDAFLEGATPGGWLVLVAGRTLGTQAIPGCHGLVSGISAPLLVGAAAADEAGRWMIRRQIPPGLTGQTLWLQGVDLTSCTTTKLRAQTF